MTEVGTASFLDEGSFSFQTHRPPVAQTFEVIGSGARFTLVANHIRSRNCGGDAERFQDQLDGQGCASIAREEATQELLAWLETTPTGDANAPVMIAGDFNSYSMETPARLIQEANFTNAKSLVEKQLYSYVFAGRLGSLDHIFIANDVTEALVDMDIWRVNADEPSAFGYESAFKSEDQQALYYNAGPYRSSDHNPVVILLDSTKL